MNFFFFLLVVFTLPISRQLFTIALWPWLFTWVIEGRYREKFRISNLKENLHSIIFLSALYLLMLVSISWSSDYVNGFRQMGIQASMIIFPVFLSFKNGIYNKKESLRKVFISLIAGIIIITLILIFKALIYTVSIKQGQFNFNPIINEWENVFFFSRFSYLIHPTYLGIMIVFALAVLLVDMKKRLIIGKGSVMHLVLIAYLYFIVFLLSSRSIILVSVIIGLILTTYLINNRLLRVIALLLIISGIFLAANLNPRTARFIENLKDNGRESYEEVDVRFKIWKSTLQILKENPLWGVGTGDVKHRLKQVYDKEGYEFPTIFNCHSQYLEQWLSSGIISLLLLIAGLLLPLFFRDKQVPGIYYSSFLIIISFVFLFESVLCRFWGVAFFSMFYTLITRRCHSEQSEESL